MKKYGVCPKCNLNYIDVKKQEICDICKKQMSGESTVIDDFLLEEDYTNEELHSPFLQNPTPLHSDYEEDKQDEEDDGEDAVWRSYIDDDDGDLNIPDFSFDDEEEEEEEEEGEETTDVLEDDDFEYVSVDDYRADDGDDDDDEEDDEDDFNGVSFCFI